MPRHRDLAIAAAALLLLPFALRMLGLGITSASEVVIFAMACMALNILVGYTGLVSFGHGAWFGVGAYAAALTQRYWFPGSVLWPGCSTRVLQGVLHRRLRGSPLMETEHETTNGCAHVSPTRAEPRNHRPLYQ